MRLNPARYRRHLLVPGLTNLDSDCKPAVEIEVILTSTSVDGEPLDAVVAQLSTLDCVIQAFWSPSTTE